MKKITILLIAFLAVSNISFAQENIEKVIWADSFLGEKAPELVVERYMNFKPKTEGKYLLLEFWATWCSACRRAVPKLNLLQKEFEDKMVIIGLSEEDEQQVLSMQNPVIEFASAIDTQGRLRKYYGVYGYPHAVLISPDGVVVWEGFPLLKDHELNSERLKELLK